MFPRLDNSMLALAHTELLKLTNGDDGGAHTVSPDPPSPSMPTHLMQTTCLSSTVSPVKRGQESSRSPKRPMPRPPQISRGGTRNGRRVVPVSLPSSLPTQPFVEEIPPGQLKRIQARGAPLVAEAEQWLHEFKVWQNTAQKESTDFASLHHWGQNCLEEAYEALRENNGDVPTKRPHRLLTTVSCMVLDKIMSSQVAYKQLWGALRTEIFSAVFVDFAAPTQDEYQPPERPATRPRPQHSRERTSPPPPPPPLPVSDFTNMYTHHEAKHISAAREEEALRIVAEYRYMAEKFTDISDLTTRSHGRELVGFAFRGWKGLVRGLKHRRRVGVGVKRRAGDTQCLTLAFVRWRRHTNKCRTRQKEKALEGKCSVLLNSNSETSAALDGLTATSKEQIHFLQTELESERELRRNLIDGHLAELQEWKFQASQAKADFERSSLACTNLKEVVSTVVHPAINGAADTLINDPPPSSGMLTAAQQLYDLDARMSKATDPTGTPQETKQVLIKLVREWLSYEGAAYGLDRSMETLADLSDGELLLMAGTAVTTRLREIAEQEKETGANQLERKVSAQLFSASLDVHSTVNEALVAGSAWCTVTPLLLFCPAAKKLFTKSHVLLGDENWFLWLAASLLHVRCMLPCITALPLQLMMPRRMPQLNAFALSNVTVAAPASSGGGVGLTVPDGGDGARRRSSVMPGFGSATGSGHDLSAQRSGANRRASRRMSSVTVAGMSPRSGSATKPSKTFRSAVLVPVLPLEIAANSTDEEKLVSRSKYFHSASLQWMTLGKVVASVVLRHQCIDPVQEQTRGESFKRRMSSVKSIRFGS